MDVRFVDTTFPNGPQGLWAMGMRHAMMDHRMDEAVEKSVRTRADRGYPIMITPFSSTW